jgi:nitrogenase subunit NifH
VYRKLAKTIMTRSNAVIPGSLDDERLRELTR